MENENRKNSIESNKLEMLKLDIKKVEDLMMNKFNAISKRKLSLKFIKDLPSENVRLFRKFWALNSVEILEGNLRFFDLDVSLTRL